jgi:flavonol synthase
VVNNYPTWTYDTDVADDQKLPLLEHADGSVVTVLHQR